MINNTQGASASLPVQNWHPHSRTERQPDESERERVGKGHGKHYHDRANDSVSLSPQAQEANASTAASASNLAIQDLTASVNQAFDIQIKTKEGDVVTISFDGSESSHLSAFSADTQDVSVQGYQSEYTQSSNFSITVEGDLSDAESESLSDLLKQMQNVGHDFFQGNTKGAFQQAQNMGFDEEQIAGFSMSLSMDQSVRAISAYQSVEGPQQVDSNTLKDASNYFNGLQDAFAPFKDLLNSFQDPQQAADDLSGGAVKSIVNQYKAQPNIQNHADTLKKLMSWALSSPTALVLPDVVNNTANATTQSDETGTNSTDT